MRVLMINVLCGLRSTGRICLDLAQQFEAQGHQVKIAYGRDFVPEKAARYAIRVGTDWSMRWHGLRSRLLDQHGLGSVAATRRFLAWAEEYQPDLLWLHNLHGYYLNYEMLFAWIKKHPQMQVKWTLHDCWAFTGHCPHFTVAQCDKWQTQCHHCPQLRRYPASLVADASGSNYRRKKAAFTGVANMTLITPSQWLADKVKQSFLNSYPVQVVPNEIDRSVFKPTPSHFRQTYGLENKIVVLGVAYPWDEYKGLYDFYRLSELLDERFQVVLVGLSEKQLRTLPPSILGLKRTESPAELAQLYTAADYFLNPSREETFGMTTLEAACCGCKTIVYASTASEETAQKYGGLAVPPTVEALHDALLKAVAAEEVRQ